MKRFLSFFLIITMLLSLFACGEGSKSTNDTENAAGGSLRQDQTLSIGTVNGTTYENKFIGIGCEFPKGWTFDSEEKVKEVNQISSEKSGDDLQKALEALDRIEAMFGMSKDKLSNVSVVLKKKSGNQTGKIDMKKYMEESSDELLSSLKKAGVKDADLSFEVGSITVDGQKLAVANIEAKVAIVTLYQAHVGIDCNGYIATISINSNSSKTLKNILDGLYLTD